MLKGTMSIAADAAACIEMSMVPGYRIISLDEDSSEQGLSSIYNPNVLAGTILLPATEVMWAEIDGNVELFQELYFQQLTSIHVHEFFTALIAYVYNGGHLIFYYPEFDASNIDNSLSIQFLLSFMWNVFGLHVGTGPNDLFFYDMNKIPLYLEMFYDMQIIDHNQLLKQYPQNLDLPYQLYKLIIERTSIYGETEQEQIDYIRFLRARLLSSNKISYSVLRRI